jgi:hypothetical protein
MLVSPTFFVSIGWFQGRASQHRLASGELVKDSHWLNPSSFTAVRVVVEGRFGIDKRPIFLGIGTGGYGLRLAMSLATERG